MSELTQFLKKRQKINLLMAAVNVAVFIVLSLMGSTTDVRFMLEHGAAYTPYILDGGQHWRLFTSMFLHFGLAHILYNMLCLIYLGDMLERAVGPVRYLIVYLGGGICGNLLSMAWDLHTQNFVVSAGASGAIFACIGADLWITLKNRRYLNRNYVRRFAVMAVLMIIQGFMDMGTDAMAHLGGFAAGFVLGFLLTLGMRMDPRKIFVN